MMKFFQMMKMFLGVGLIICFVNSVAAEDQQNKKQKKNWQEATQKILNSLPKDQYEKLKKLQKEDPQAFRKEIRVLTKKYNKNFQKTSSNKEMDDLVLQYHVAQGDEKEKIKEKIKEKVTEQFNKKMANNRANVERTEKRLNELKRLLKVREENAEKIIQERIEYLTRDPGLRW